MKEILGHIIITSPLWVVGVGAVLIFGWDAVKAVILTAAFVGFVYGTYAIGSRLLE